MQPVHQSYQSSINYRKDITRLYRLLLPSLLNSYPRWDPYTIVSHVFFTPIEENVWAHIRSTGLPMLPQFPVGNYFLDFADPVRKIGIEVDGKLWHQDKDKDRRRQIWLERQGWKIFRIEGIATFYDTESFDYNEERAGLPFLSFIIGEKVYNCSSEAALIMIKREYYSDIYSKSPKREELMHITRAIISWFERQEKLLQQTSKNSQSSSSQSFKQNTQL